MHVNTEATCTNKTIHAANLTIVPNKKRLSADPQNPTSSGYAGESAAESVTVTPHS